MRDRLCLDYKYIFGDHMARCSHQAKLYYIKLMFHAENGFVANSLEILDSLGFDKSVFIELVANEEILTLPGRSEVFITSYFLHTHFNPASWLSSPYAIYWKGKLYTKKNGVATFTPQSNADPSAENHTQSEIKRLVNEIADLHSGKAQWDSILADIESVK